MNDETQQNDGHDFAAMLLLLTDLEAATGDPCFAEARHALISCMARLLNRELVMRLRGIETGNPPPPIDIEWMKANLQVV